MQGISNPLMEDIEKTKEQLIAELTELRQTVTKQEESERRRRLLFDHSPDGIVIVDPKTAGFLEFNATAHRQLGYTRKEFACLGIPDVEAMETPDETRAHIEKVMREGRSDFDTRHKTKKGSWIPATTSPC